MHTAVMHSVKEESNAHVRPREIVLQPRYTRTRLKPNATRDAQTNPNAVLTADDRSQNWVECEGGHATDRDSRSIMLLSHCN